MPRISMNTGEGCREWEKVSERYHKESIVCALPPFIRSVCRATISALSMYPLSVHLPVESRVCRSTMYMK